MPTEIHNPISLLCLFFCSWESQQHHSRLRSLHNQLTPPCLVPDEKVLIGKEINSSASNGLDEWRTGRNSHWNHPINKICMGPQNTWARVVGISHNVDLCGQPTTVEFTTGSEFWRFLSLDTDKVRTWFRILIKCWLLILDGGEEWLLENNGFVFLICGCVCGNWEHRKHLIGSICINQVPELHYSGFTVVQPCLGQR